MMKFGRIFFGVVLSIFSSMVFAEKCRTEIGIEKIVKDRKSVESREMRKPVYWEKKRYGYHCRKHIVQGKNACSHTQFHTDVVILHTAKAIYIHRDVAARNKVCTGSCDPVRVAILCDEKN